MARETPSRQQAALEEQRAAVTVIGDTRLERMDAHVEVYQAVELHSNPRQQFSNSQ